jgi:hypothetical protein
VEAVHIPEVDGKLDWLGDGVGALRDRVTLYYLLLRNYRAQRGELTPLFKMSILLAAVWNLHLFAGHYLWHLT